MSKRFFDLLLRFAIVAFLLGSTDAIAQVSDLVKAARQGQTERVKVLIQDGVDVNEKDEDGKTALMYAGQEGHTEIMQALLNAGAYLNAKDQEGWTALIYAVKGGHTKSVKALLEGDKYTRPSPWYRDGQFKILDAQTKDEIYSFVHYQFRKRLLNYDDITGKLIPENKVEIHTLKQWQDQGRLVFFNRGSADQAGTRILLLDEALSKDDLPKDFQVAKEESNRIEMIRAGNSAFAKLMKTIRKLQIARKDFRTGKKLVHSWIEDDEVTIRRTFATEERLLKAAIKSAEIDIEKDIGKLTNDEKTVIMEEFKSKVLAGKGWGLEFNKERNIIAIERDYLHNITRIYSAESEKDRRYLLKKIKKNAIFLDTAGNWHDVSTLGNVQIAKIVNKKTGNEIRFHASSVVYDIELMEKHERQLKTKIQTLKRYIRQSKGINPRLHDNSTRYLDILENWGGLSDPDFSNATTREKSKLQFVKFKGPHERLDLIEKVTQWLKDEDSATNYYEYKGKKLVIEFGLKSVKLALRNLRDMLNNAENDLIGIQQGEVIWLNTVSFRKTVSVGQDAVDRTWDRLEELAKRYGFGGDGIQFDPIENSFIDGRFKAIIEHGMIQREKELAKAIKMAAGVSPPVKEVSKIPAKVEVKPEPESKIPKAPSKVEETAKEQEKEDIVVDVVLDKAVASLRIAKAYVDPFTNSFIWKYEGTNYLIIIDDSIAEAKKSPTPLQVAARNGQTEIVEILLKAGVDVNAKDIDSCTALMFAADKGHLEIVKALLNAGAAVNAKEQAGRTALTLAAKEGQVETVQALLKAGADVGATNEDNWTALIFAAYNGYTEIVDILLTTGADVNIKTEKSSNALISAAENGHTEIVKDLLSAGAEVNVKNKNGSTALILAAQNGHIEIVEALLKARANLNATDRDNRNALMFASREGHTDIVHALLATGAKVNTKTKGDSTALTFAAQKGHTEIVQALLTAGAKVTNSTLELAIQNNRLETVQALLEAGAEVNYTTLMLAAANDNTEILESLRKAGEVSWAKTEKNLSAKMLTAARLGDTRTLESLLRIGADVNAKDADFGSTALMLASGNGHTQTVKTLLRAGAELNAKDEEGWTALMFAARNGHRETVEVLLMAGADVNARDKDGFTALSLAKKYDHTEIVEALLKKDNKLERKSKEALSALLLEWGTSKEALSASLLAVATSLKKGNKLETKSKETLSVSLRAAAIFGLTEALEALLKAGADVNVKEEDFEHTALMLAAHYGHTETVEALIKAGADVNAKNYFGLTALSLASHEGHTEIVQLLRQAGAEE